VNQTDRVFRINVGFLINQPIGYNREIPFNFEEHTFDEALSVRGLSGNLNLNRTQNGVRANAAFKAQVKLECGRCLEEFEQNLETQFEEMFSYNNRDLSEDEIGIPEDGNIDFEPYIRDYLMLEIPINPVCKADCRGLCDICGENLNLRDCGHKHEPPMTAMAKSMKSLEGNLPGKNAPIKE
jgi:uncharacterized protein